MGRGKSEHVPPHRRGGGSGERPSGGTRGMRAETPLVERPVAPDSRRVSPVGNGGGETAKFLPTCKAVSPCAKHKEIPNHKTQITNKLQILMAKIKNAAFRSL